MAMAISEQDSRVLLPSFLYSPSPSSLSHLRGGSFASETLLNRNRNPLLNLSSTRSSAENASAKVNAPKAFVVPAPSEPGKITMYSPAFYAACTMGGILSCGLTHTGVTPLDLVKCNMQMRLPKSPLVFASSLKITFVSSLRLQRSLLRRSQINSPAFPTERISWTCCLSLAGSFWILLILASNEAFGSELDAVASFLFVQLLPIELLFFL